MSALNLIYTCLELDAESIHSLSEKEIVRIEKRLKADIKLNKTIDSNQLELVLTVLRKYYEEFKILHNPSYDLLREILFQPERFCGGELCHGITNPEDERIAEFISAFFLEDIRSYADMCMRNDHYYGLHSLLVNSAILPPALKDEISKKCLFKIEYGTECLESDASELQRKIGVLANPYFYRCLNQLGAGNFEEEVRIFSNTNVGCHNKSSYVLFSKIMYALGFFTPVKQSFVKTLKQNKKAAYNEGVRELLYSTPELENKGATYIVGEGYSGGPEINSMKDFREWWGMMYTNFIKKK